MKYDDSSPIPIEGAFYATPSYDKSVFNYFREEDKFNLRDLLTSYDEQFKIEWPQSGSSMNWDLIGFSRKKKTWILCEAKAHLGELKSDCGASKDSKDKISRALNIVKNRLGVDTDKNWMEKYYQFANRLYAVDLINRQGFNAVLLNIYFLGDLSGKNRKSPQKESEWTDSIDKMYKTLGVPADLSIVKNLFLEVSES